MRDFTIADWSVQPDLNRISRRGVERRLTPRVMDLLVYLAERPGEVLSSEQILRDVWPDEFVGDHALLSAVSALRKALGDDPRRPRVIRTVPKRGYSLVAESTAGSGALAVLPLENLTGNADQDFLAHGMTEVLISELGKMPALRVISRHSSMVFGGSPLPVREIAGRLGARWIVEGSVLASGGRIRVTARLIEADADLHRWGESYESELGDLLRLQCEMAGEIARAVSERVRPKVAPPKEAEEVDPETIVAYLRGRYHFFKLSPEHFEKALGYFHQAIERSPDFTPAHAGVADAWGGLGYWGTVPAAEAVPHVREAVRIAQADRSNAEAQVVAGAYHFHCERDWGSAELSLRRAIRLDPNLAYARIILALYLFSTSRSEEALAEVEVARRLDPLNPAPMYVRGMWLGRCGQLEAARAEGESILELAPDFVPARALLADLDWLEERSEALAREQALWRELGPVFSVLTEVEPAEPCARLLVAARMLAELADSEDGPYVQPMRVARLFSHAGDVDSAFEWLDRAVGRNDIMQFDQLRISPAWLPLADDPRFSRVLGRLGLPA